MMPQVSSQHVPRTIRFRLIIAIPLTLFCLSVASGWGVISYYELTGVSLLTDKGRTLAAWFVILGIGLVCMLLGIAIALAVTRPLHKLTALADSLSPTVSRSRTGEDEVGSLVTAFNRMMLSLDGYVSDSYILNNLPVGVMTVDDKGQILSLNGVAREVLDLQLDDGHNVSSVLFSVPENHDAHHALDDALKGEKQNYRAIEATLSGKAGTEIRALLEIRPLPRGALLEHKHAMISFRSLTEREQVRAEIRRTDQLATLGSLAAGLAHEFRNPLGSIQGLVEIMKDDLPKDEPTHRYLETILQSTERMNRMIEELLTMTRTDSEPNVAIDIAVMLRDIILSLNPEVTKKRVEVVTQYAPDLPPVYGRPAKFRHALFNVIRNAVEATPEEGCVTIATFHGLHKHSTEMSGSTAGVVVRVTNTGSYISPEDRERIFLPFITTKPGGTGLGLFLAQQFLELEGGKIRVASTPDDGTTFEIQFSSGG